MVSLNRFFNIAAYMARLIVIIALFVTALHLASASSLGSEKPSRKTTTTTTTTTTRLVSTRRRRNEEHSESQTSQNGNQSHVKSAASPNNSVNVHRRGEEHQLKPPQQSALYYLTLFIQFDDYAYDIAWKLLDESQQHVESKLRRKGRYPYTGRRRGESVTETIPLDDYQVNFRRSTEEEQGTTFRFTMLDSHGDGLRRGGYYQLNFTNALVRETTELARASRFGDRSLVSFRLGVPSLQEQQNGAGTFVQVLDSRRSTVEEPTAFPTAPPTPLLGTSFLRCKLDFPGMIFSWKLSLLDPQTLSVTHLLQEGQYSGREDGELYFFLQLGKADTFYEFALTEENAVEAQRDRGVYELTFVPATHRDDDEIPLFLPRKSATSAARTYAISFAVFASGSKFYAATRGPTHQPTLKPTMAPSVSPAPTSENPTMSPFFRTPMPTYFVRHSSSEGTDPSEIMFLLWFCSFIGCSFAYCLFNEPCLNCRRQLARLRVSYNSDDALGRAGSLATPQARPQEQNRPQHQPSSRLVRGLPPDERPRYIRKNLLSVTIGSMNDGTEVPQCAICLEEYEDGDVICFSGNSHCEHKFHRDCMTAWLKSHEECPCCRLVYLPSEHRAEA